MTDLYTQDFYRWTQEQAKLLDARQFDALDIANLVEEVESLGKSEQRALENRLIRLVVHLLKWRYQAQRRQTGHSWYYTIREQRLALARLLRKNPSLRATAVEALSEVYPQALLVAARQTKLPLTTFPDPCPWTVEQVLDEAFWPDDAATS